MQPQCAGAWRTSNPNGKLTTACPHGADPPCGPLYRAALPTYSPHMAKLSSRAAQEEAEEAARLQAAAEADEEARAGGAGEEGEARRFWVRSADFAAVAVYVRPLVGERPPHHLLPMQQFLETAGRVYTAGERAAIPGDRRQSLHRRWRPATIRGNSEAQQSAHQEPRCYGHARVEYPL